MKLMIQFDFPVIKDTLNEIMPRMIYTTLEIHADTTFESLVIKALKDLRREGLALDVPLASLPSRGTICSIQFYPTEEPEFPKTLL